MKTMSHISAVTEMSTADRNNQRSETKAVLEYIENNWDSCIKENKSDKGDLIGLPYPYTVPAVGHFDEMYYWDTYFTNKGLEIDGRHELAKNNVDNMLYLVDRYGFMPNGNRTYFLNHSQPPFLSLMVRDVYENCGDKEWLGRAYKSLQTEYKFWTEKRGSQIGLARYDDDNAVFTSQMAADYVGRIGYKPEGYTDSQIAREYLAICESGWDANPRFEYETYDNAAVDLNSLLYALESNMAYFADELENGESEAWTKLASDRKATMIKYFENEDGLLVDYNFEKKKQSEIFSVASLYPLFVGLADEKHAKAVMDNLDRLERESTAYSPARKMTLRVHSSGMHRMAGLVCSILRLSDWITTDTRRRQDKSLKSTFYSSKRCLRRRATFGKSTMLSKET